VSAVEDGAPPTPLADGDVRIIFLPNVEEVAHGNAQSRARFSSAERAFDVVALLLAKGHYKLPIP